MDSYRFVERVAGQAYYPPEADVGSHFVYQPLFKTLKRNIYIALRILSFVFHYIVAKSKIVIPHYNAYIAFLNLNTHLPSKLY